MRTIPFFSLYELCFQELFISIRRRTCFKSSHDHFILFFLLYFYIYTIIDVPIPLHPFAHLPPALASPPLRPSPHSCVRSLCICVLWLITSLSFIQSLIPICIKRLCSPKHTMELEQPWNWGRNTCFVVSFPLSLIYLEPMCSLHLARAHH